MSIKTLSTANVNIGSKPDFPNGLTVSSGNVGIGTRTASYPLDVQTLGSGVTIAQRLVVNSSYFTFANGTVTVNTASKIGTITITSAEAYTSSLIYTGMILTATSAVGNLGTMAAGTYVAVTGTSVNGSSQLVIAYSYPGGTDPVAGTITSVIVSGYVAGWGPSLLFTGGGASVDLASIAGLVGTSNSNTAGDLAFYTRSSGTLAERMRITSSGNVGIGTTSPGANLDILGGTTQGFNYLLRLSPVSGTTSAALGRESFINFGATFSNNWTGTDYGTRYSGGISYGAYGGATNARSWSMKFATGDDLAGDTPTERMRLFSTGVASSATLRVGGIISTYTAGNYTATGQEINRHSIVFSSWRDAQQDTLGAKIEAINYTNNNAANLYHLTQRTDIVFSTLSAAYASSTDSTTEKMRITSAGKILVNVNTDNGPQMYVSGGAADTPTAYGFAVCTPKPALTAGSYSNMAYFANNRSALNDGLRIVNVRASTGANIGDWTTEDFRILRDVDQNGNSGSAQCAIVWGSSTLSLMTANASRIYINSSGNVGIGTTDPKATLHANGTFAITTATSGTANSVILAAANYALPNATTCSGRMYWVKNTSTGAITMTSAGGTIDGVAAGTGVSLAQYDCYTVISDGTNWFII